MAVRKQLICDDEEEARRDSNPPAIDGSHGNELSAPMALKNACISRPGTFGLRMEKKATKEANESKVWEVDSTTLLASP